MVVLELNSHDIASHSRVAERLIGIRLTVIILMTDESHLHLPLSLASLQ
jgi:hypothetical protein